MKDFKQTPKMNAEGSHYCKGGKVKKMQTGGSTSDFADYNAPSAESEIGQKIGLAASSNAEQKYRTDNGLSKSNMASSRAGQKAYDEAQNEARRESTRGIQTKKRGGSVKRKK